MIRFEYLQANTGDTVHVKEVEIDKVKRRNTTDMKVVGDEYTENGDVLAWRASVVRGDEVLATSESFLWD